MRAPLAGLLLVAACQRPDPAGDAAAPVEDTGAPALYEVSGRIVDLDDQPVVDVFVTVSTDFCIPDRTASDGSFTVGRVDPGPKRLITYGETAANGLFASVSAAFEPQGDTTFPEPVRTPRLDERWPVDPAATTEQRVVSADGLELTIPPGSLSLAPFAPSEVQVARVPPDRAPPVVPDGVELADLFVLHPILSTFDPPAPVAFPADTGLPPGTRVTFHALDYDLGVLVPVAAGTVDAAGRPVTDAGQGIPELTWIGLSVE